MFGLPPVTQTLILINLAVFFAATLGIRLPLDALVLWPLGPDFRPWQLLSYGFLHGDFSHLLFNMFGLYMFGADVEQVWGPKRFLNYYLICVLSAALAQLAVALLMGSGSPTLGASGGVFGLLIAFALLFPNRVIVPLIPPIPMRAPIFVALYGGVELFLGVTGTQAGVAHFAHLGGLAGGYCFIKFWPRGRSGGRRLR
jgi:membrane associated rhomboid family serine protease